VKLTARVVVAVALLFGARASADTSTAGTSTISTSTAGTQPPDVRQVFLSDCATCHGADAHGTNAGPTLEGVGRAAIDYELSTGRMPLSSPDRVPTRHPPAYSSATIAELVNYTDNLAGGDGPPIPRVGTGNLADGGDLFRMQCAACHAWAADGGALLHREAPALHASTPVQIAEAVRVGPGQMPAFGTAALTDPQLDGVVAYVRYLDKPRDRGGNPLWHLGPVAEGGMALVILAGLLCFVLWIGERG
jgi:ubiquinol-cytochrome c reductase cytochrome c subunit